MPPASAALGKPIAPGEILDSCNRELYKHARSPFNLHRGEVRHGSSVDRVRDGGCGPAEWVLPRSGPEGRRQEGSANDYKVSGPAQLNWKQLGLTDEQKNAVYKVQTEYGAKIDALEAQIKELKQKQEAEEYKVLPMAEGPPQGDPDRQRPDDKKPEPAAGSEEARREEALRRGSASRRTSQRGRGPVSACETAARSPFFTPFCIAG
jgi:hypothetical protein